MAEKYLRNAWYCAADASEVTRKPLGRVFLNEPVVMYRREDGTAVALEDTCCHRRAPLHLGTVEGDNIQCAYHGMMFDSTGAAVWAQGQDRFPQAMRVRAYPLIERYGWLWIWMGEPARADESLIFDAGLCTNPKWATVKGVIHVKANAMLVIDNLMDLSHTAFVHKATVGTKEDLNPELVWERRENWIQGTRMARDLTPSMGYVKRGAGDYKLDQTKQMAYTPPYNCNVDIYTMEAGRKLGEGRFNEQFLTYNLITPETDTTCFYFWANCRDFRIDDQGFNDINYKVGVALLEEDRGIVEAVQQMVSLVPDRPEVDLVADAGGVQARRILKRLIDDESFPPSAAKTA